MFKLFKPIDDYKAAYTKLKKEYEELRTIHGALREINKRDLQVLQIAMHRINDLVKRIKELQLGNAELQKELLEQKHENLKLSQQLLESQTSYLYRSTKDQTK